MIAAFESDELTLCIILQTEYLYSQRCFCFVFKEWVFPVTPLSFTQEQLLGRKCYKANKFDELFYMFLFVFFSPHGVLSVVNIYYDLTKIMIFLVFLCLLHVIKCD